jgi:UDP-N-acetyl-D-mannosaminuronate dehydrogenase
VIDGEKDLDAALKAADVVVVLQNHKAYDLDDIVKKSKVVFDTRGTLRAPNVVRL